MTMKRFTAAVVFGLMCLSVFPAAAQQKKNAPKTVDPRREAYFLKKCGGDIGGTALRVVGFKEYPPFSWSSEDMKFYHEKKRHKYFYHGFVYNHLRETLKNIKLINIENLVSDSFAETQKAMLHGKIDVLFQSYYLDESSSGMDFVYPAYFGNPLVVVSRKTKPVVIDDASELKGLKGVIRKEEEIDGLVRGLLPTDTKIDVVDGAETAFRMLLSGDADFMITSPYAADAESKRFKIKDKIVIGKRVLRHIKYFMAFSKMSPCRAFKDRFTRALAESFKDKAAVEKQILQSIQDWVNLHADDPALEYTPADDGQNKRQTVADGSATENAVAADQSAENVSDAEISEQPPEPAPAVADTQSDPAPTPAAVAPPADQPLPPVRGFAPRRQPAESAPAARSAAPKQWGRRAR